MIDLFLGMSPLPRTVTFLAFVLIVSFITCHLVWRAFYKGIYVRTTLAMELWKKFAEQFIDYGILEYLCKKNNITRKRNEDNHLEVPDKTELQFEAYAVMEDAIERFASAYEASNSTLKEFQEDSSTWENWRVKIWQDENKSWKVELIFISDGLTVYSTSGKGLVLERGDEWD